jgi:peptide/nickel transport system substrate-binding protein
MNYRKVEQVMHDPSLPMQAIARDSSTYAYMGVNQNSPNLRDPRVRMALAKSFDLAALIRYKSRGLAKQSRGMLADMNYYADLSVPVISRDVEGAKKLLDEAGFSNGTNGKPPLVVHLKTSSSPIAVENAQVLAAQAKEAGIILEHRAFDWGIFFADVKSGNTELYTLSWPGISDPHLYYELFNSAGIGQYNRTRYKNPEMDRLTLAGDATSDPVKRRAIYNKVQELAAKDLPFISLWHPMNTAVFRKNIKGVTLHPLGTWRVILSMRKDPG